MFLFIILLFYSSSAFIFHIAIDIYMNELMMLIKDFSFVSYSNLKVGKRIKWNYLACGSMIDDLACIMRK